MSDQITAEIERSVDDFSKRVDEQVMAIYAGNGMWLVSAHKMGLRVQNPDVMAALREFEAKLQKIEKAVDMVAQTLGLEAAE